MEMTGSTPKAIHGNNAVHVTLSQLRNPAIAHLNNGRSLNKQRISSLHKFQEINSHHILLQYNNLHQSFKH